MHRKPINSETPVMTAVNEDLTWKKVPRINRNPPVSPGTATFAIVPYMKAHSPNAATYSLHQFQHFIDEITGKAVAVPTVC
jgi:hypothetical protein